MTAKKAVLELSIHEERIRTKAFVKVSGFPGVSSVTIDEKTGKLTVVGEVDVSVLVMKLRKICHTAIVSVEAVKPPEKKPEKPAQPTKPDEFFGYPVIMHYPYPYSSAYPCADSYHQPNTCVIMFFIYC